MSHEALRMNERPLFGSGEPFLHVQVWVSWLLQLAERW